MTPDRAPGMLLEPHTRDSRGSFLWGVFAGCAGSLVLLFALLAISALIWMFAGVEDEVAAQPPRLELEVADDGCGVIRTDPPEGPPNMLTWVVTDEEGFRVLGRNAENETSYRHYGSGSYDVVLQAHDGEKYVNVSNKVSIECP